MKLKLDPTKLLTIILFLFASGAIIANDFKLQILIHLAATLGFGLILFALFKFISKKNKNISNTVISCLILFLILHYGLKNSDVIFALIATFITIFSKFFFEYKGSPIINPVVFALLIMVLVSKIFTGIPQPFISWWGTSYRFDIASSLPITTILMAIWVICGLYKWRKLPIFFSYLIFFAILIAIFYKEPPGVEKFSTLKFIFTDSTLYFFTAVMLVEPKTSPFTKSQQIIYGILAAVISALYVLFNIPAGNLLAIAVPNLYFFGAKMIQNRNR